MRRTRTCLALAATLLMSACGGSDAGVTSPLTIATNPAMTGTLVPFDNVYDELMVGRVGNGPGRRAYLAFDLSQVPEGAIITEATLRFVQTSSVGAPELAFGDFLIESVDLGTALTFGEDWGTPAIGLAQKLGSGAPMDGPFQHDVTSWVQADLDHPRPFASFRLHLQSILNPPPGDHYARLDDPNHIDYAGPATLTVAWTMP